MIKNIIWDFDGVILDSLQTKKFAFRKLFSDFSRKEVKELISYHENNLGVSRFDKINYFFEKVIAKKTSKNKIKDYLTKYSKLTRNELSKKKYIIKQTIEFIKLYKNDYNMHIASGAEEKDLKYICKKLEISNFFLSINGSPTHKSLIVRNILTKKKYKRKETILIGDSDADYKAAKNNKIKFYHFKKKKNILVNDFK